MSFLTKKRSNGVAAAAKTQSICNKRAKLAWDDFEPIPLSEKHEDIQDDSWKFLLCEEETLDLTHVTWSEKEADIQDDCWKILLQERGTKIEKIYYVRKSVLVANSCYFAAICRPGSAFVEATSQTSEIVDLHPLEIHAFPLLLDYISGRLPNFLRDGIEKGYLGALVSLADRFILQEPPLARSDCLKPVCFGLEESIDAAYSSFEPFMQCQLVQDCLTNLKLAKTRSQDVVQAIQAKMRHELPKPIAKKLRVQAQCQPFPLNDFCVLAERGGRNASRANAEYRKIVRGFRPEFLLRAVTNAKKKEITLEALAAVKQAGLMLVKRFRSHEHFPFLDNGMVYLLDEKKAYSKCIQYIRDGKQDLDRLDPIEHHAHGDGVPSDGGGVPMEEGGPVPARGEGVASGELGFPSDGDSAPIEGGLLPMEGIALDADGLGIPVAVGLNPIQQAEEVLPVETVSDPTAPDIDDFDLDFGLLDDIEIDAGMFDEEDELRPFCY